jgi:hypothetical protein
VERGLFGQEFFSGLVLGKIEMTRREGMSYVFPSFYQNRAFRETKNQDLPIFSQIQFDINLFIFHGVCYCCRHHHHRRCLLGLMVRLDLLRHQKNLMIKTRKK